MLKFYPLASTIPISPQRTAVWRVWRADSSSTIGPERRLATCNRRAAPRSHHADSTTAPLAARASTSDL